MSSNHELEGYFSIVRFVPDEFRSEGVNVGVVLLCPEARTLKWDLSIPLRKVRRFFGTEENLDPRRLKTMVAGLEEQLRERYADLLNPGSLCEFIKLFRNQLQLTDLRSCVVTNPATDLAALSSRLVGERPASSPRAMTAQQIRAAFRHQLELKGLYDRLEHNYEIAARYKPTPYLFSHAYRNGRLHVIHEESFATVDANENCERALVLAAEIEDARSNAADNYSAGQTEFTVIVSFAPEQVSATQSINRLFHDKNINLRTTEQMKDVVEQIAQELREHSTRVD